MSLAQSSLALNNFQLNASPIGMGTSGALVAGTLAVADPRVGPNTEVFFALNTVGGTVGYPRVSAKTAGTGFTITSTSATDTSTYDYILFNPIA